MDFGWAPRGSGGGGGFQVGGRGGSSNPGFRVNTTTTPSGFVPSRNNNNQFNPPSGFNPTTPGFAPRFSTNGGGNKNNNNNNNNNNPGFGSNRPSGTGRQNQTNGNGGGGRIQKNRGGNSMQVDRTRPSRGNNNNTAASRPVPPTVSGFRPSFGAAAGGGGATPTGWNPNFNSAQQQNVGRPTNTGRSNSRTGGGGRGNVVAPSTRTNPTRDPTRGGTRGGGRTDNYPTSTLARAPSTRTTGRAGTTTRGGNNTTGRTARGGGFTARGGNATRGGGGNNTARGGGGNNATRIPPSTNTTSRRSPGRFRSPNNNNNNNNLQPAYQKSPPVNYGVNNNQITNEEPPFEENDEQDEGEIEMDMDLDDKDDDQIGQQEEGTQFPIQQPVVNAAAGGGGGSAVKGRAQPKYQGAVDTTNVQRVIKYTLESNKFHDKKNNSKSLMGTPNTTKPQKVKLQLGTPSVQTITRSVNRCSTQ